MIPSDDEIKKALTTVDYQNVVVDGNTVTLKDPSAKIDLGGIAKGYIADRMKDYLNQRSRLRLYQPRRQCALSWCKTGRFFL